MKGIALTFFIFLIGSSCTTNAQQKSPRFKVIALYENGGHHILYSQRAKIWLNKLAADSNFSIDYIQNTDSINDNFLSKYNLFIQLDYPPYGWKDTAAHAFATLYNRRKGRMDWVSSRKSPGRI